MLLQLVNQDLGYDRGPVLRDISISIHAGDRIALVGESGAGKSTLLTVIQARLLEQAAVAREELSVAPDAARLARLRSLLGVDLVADPAQLRDRRVLVEEAARHLAQHLLLMLRNGPVRFRADVQQQATVLADNVDQIIDQPIGRLVPLVPRIAP